MLKLENLKKVYDGVTILENINLNIEDGEIISILGPSGCGKTTLLNLILGIAEADGGHIVFNGQDITDVPMEKRGFNIVFQDYALFPNLNVYENITYGLRNNPGISTEEEVQELIELLGLEEHLNKRIDQLSGGQKQRSSIARALIKNAPILILDDSLSAVDTDTEEHILHNLRDDRKGKTTILIAHRFSTVQHADLIMVLENGEMKELGTHTELIQKNGIYKDMFEKQQLEASIGEQEVINS